MTRFSHEIGRVDDADDGTVMVGVNYDRVTIMLPTFGVQLDQQQAEEFASLFVAACWEAARCHQCDCPPEYQPGEARDVE